MKWPADVIAQIALDEWPNKRTAQMAVAICLTATNGDDSFLYVPGANVLPSLKGAWAIPWLPEMETVELNPFALRDNAKLARIMTGPNGDEWEWSAVYKSGNWKSRINEAKQAIENPRLGISTVSPIPVERMSGVADALRHMAFNTATALEQSARAFRQPLNPRI